MHDNFEDHDESIEYEIEVETDADVQAIPDEGLVLARDMLPARLPIIPLRPRPAFPGVIIPLTVNGASRVKTIKQAMETESQAIGLVMVQDLDEEDLGLEEDPEMWVLSGAGGGVQSNRRLPT